MSLCATDLKSDSGNGPHIAVHKKLKRFKLHLNESPAGAGRIIGRAEGLLVGI